MRLLVRERQAKLFYFFCGATEGKGHGPGEDTYDKIGRLLRGIDFNLTTKVFSEDEFSAIQVDTKDA